MRVMWLALALGSLGVHAAQPAHGEPDPELRVDYSNPGLTPSTWTLVLHPDGSGHFHSDFGAASAAAIRSDEIEPKNVDEDVRLSDGFTARVFETVRSHHGLANESCESHLKVAFQGWKKISYSGPEGEGPASSTTRETRRFNRWATRLWRWLPQLLRERAWSCCCSMIRWDWTTRWGT